MKLNLKKFVDRKSRLAALGLAGSFCVLGCLGVFILLNGNTAALAGVDRPGQVADISNAPAGEKTVVEGKASWYDYVLADGWSSKGHFVCAARHFERSTIVRVTNLENGKAVQCLVTDYGPDEDMHPDRVIDLSSTSFRRIASLKQGIIRVKVEALFKI
jgi:rare lipoprotein A (peptidoglycan hydrolase)